MSVSWNKLLDLLFEVFVKQFHEKPESWSKIGLLINSFITDETYKPITKQQLYDFLNYWISSIIPNLHYVLDIFDCDDFAMHMKVEAAKYFGYEYNSFGFAWGFLCYEGVCVAHAWHLFVLKDYGYGLEKYGFGIVFTEPQIGEELMFIERNGYLSIESSDGFKYIFMGVII
mgnify:CR=1 FL=1